MADYEKVIAGSLSVGDKFYWAGLPKRIFEITDVHSWVNIGDGTAETDKMTCRLINSNTSGDGYWIRKNQEVCVIERAEQEEITSVQYKQKYLYESVFFETVASFIEQKVEEGWELISVMPTMTNKSFSYVLMMKAQVVS